MIFPSMGCTWNNRKALEKMTRPYRSLNGEAEPVAMEADLSFSKSHFIDSCTLILYAQKLSLGSELILNYESGNEHENQVHDVAGSGVTPLERGVCAIAGRGPDDGLAGGGVAHDRE